MARAFRLQVVLDLAEQRLDAATRELQRLRERCTEAQSKLGQLKADAMQYASDLGARLSQGLAAHQLNDYRLFLDKLERAMQAQSEEVERQQRAWEEEHARWSRLRQRQRSLLILAQRHHRTEAVVEARGEQKRQDEFGLKSVKDPPPRS